jgi:hypothetical protein
MINRSSKIDVAEMSWAVDHVSAARVTQLVFIYDAHPWIVNCVPLREESLFIVDLLRGEVADRQFLDFIWVKNSKRDSVSFLLLNVGVLLGVTCFHFRKTWKKPLVQEFGLKRAWLAKRSDDSANLLR